MIIPTFKRTQWLQELLQSLTKLDFPADRFEVIVVDDGSPNAAQKKESITAAGWPFQLSYLQQNQKGPAAARNLGAANAASDVLVFTDDDVVVDPTWLTEIIKGIDERGVGGTAGKTLTMKANTLTERYLSFVNHLSEHHVGASGELAYIITVNAAFPKSAFTAVGGFDEIYPFPSGEDIDLGFRLRQSGYKFKVNEGAKIWHRQRDNLWSMWKTWFIYGRGAYMSARRNLAVSSGGGHQQKLIRASKGDRRFY